MLPLSDIHFVACGIATFAATFGYKFARKHAHILAFDTRDEKHRRTRFRRAASPDSQFDTDIFASILDPVIYTFDQAKDVDNVDTNPLKRKAVEEYSESVEDKPSPKKRGKSPSVEKDNLKDLPTSLPDHVIETTLKTDTCTQIQDSDEGNFKQRHMTPPSPPPSPIRSPVHLPEPLSEPVLEEPVHTTTSNAVASKSLGPEATTTPKPNTTGFAAFAGSSGSAFVLPDVNRKNSTPTWFSGSTSEANTTQDESKGELEGPLGKCVGAKSTYTHTTGEEGETVLHELRGARLFVKRAGAQEFGGGMNGCVRLLTRDDSESDEKRLLFRREPLWQPGMNVRLKKSVRCTFDRAEGVLRVIVLEPSTAAPGEPESTEVFDSRHVQEGTQGKSREPKYEPAVYAIKASRAGKSKFYAFADALVATMDP